MITSFRSTIIGGILSLVFLFGIAIYSLVTPGTWYHGEFNSTAELKNLRSVAGFIPIQGRGRWRSMAPRWLSGLFSSNLPISIRWPTMAASRNSARCGLRWCY